MRDLILFAKAKVLELKKKKKQGLKPVTMRTRWRSAWIDLNPNSNNTV
jgi:hypothetical protein